MTWGSFHPGVNEHSDFVNKGTHDPGQPALRYSRSCLYKQPGETHWAINSVYVFSAATQAFPLVNNGGPVVSYRSTKAISKVISMAQKNEATSMAENSEAIVATSVYNFLSSNKWMVLVCICTVAVSIYCGSDAARCYSVKSKLHGTNVELMEENARLHSTIARLRGENSDLHDEIISLEQRMRKLQGTQNALEDCKSDYSNTRYQAEQCMKKLNGDGMLFSLRATTPIGSGGFEIKNPFSSSSSSSLDGTHRSKVLT